MIPFSFTKPQFRFDAFSLQIHGFVCASSLIFIFRLVEIQGVLFNMTICPWKFLDFEPGFSSLFMLMFLFLTLIHNFLWIWMKNSGLYLSLFCMNVHEYDVEDDEEEEERRGWKVEKKLSTNGLKSNQKTARLLYLTEMTFLKFVSKIEEPK